MLIKVKRILIISVIISLILMSSCSSHPSLYITDNNGMKTTSFMAMDTIMSFSIIDRNAGKKLQKAYEMVIAFDEAFSTHIQDSEAAQINNKAVNGVLISDELLEQIQTAIKVSKMTDGAFDITVFPLVKLWGFYDGNYTVPIENSVFETLNQIGYEKIRLEKNMLYLEKGTQIDLGAIAKGYTGQKTAELLMDFKVSSGILSLGGNMQLFGLKPDGSLWNIAIQDPKDESKTIGIIPSTDCSIITSGSYQRYFEQSGYIYHHILDPHTGYPADSGLVSVTVIADDGTYADALSTGLFVTGLEKAIEIWKEYQDFEAVFVTEDNYIYITEGLKDIFITESEYYQYEYVNK